MSREYEISCRSDWRAAWICGPSYLKSCTSTGSLLYRPLWFTWMHRAISRWIGAIHPHSRLARLANRKLPTDLISKTKCFEVTAVGNALRIQFSGKSALDRARVIADASNRWGEAMIAAGYGDATHLYTMLAEGGPFVSEAHRRGLTVVSEVYILLATEDILAQERRDFPVWEPNQSDYAELRKRLQLEDVLIEKSHYFICPSVAVRDDLVTRCGIAPERIRLVPYGMNPEWLNLEAKPIRGRILFVGTADLRKGIHYLAMASQILAKRGRRYEFRVAGDVTEIVRQRPECSRLTFLDRVPRDRIHEEFQQADVFVLPSLAEGSAEVTYEALAAGVPLVVTSAAGSVVRDRVEGRIVRERDPSALADAIEQIVEDRPLRALMAQNAREWAREYTWDRYGDRLIKGLRALA